MAGPAFLVSTGSGGVLAGPSGESPAWRPAVGEAIFDHGDESLDVQAVARVGGAVTLIAPASGAGTNPFTPGEGVRDVDLVRDVLTTNEALLLETDVSALVLVTAGSVNAGGTTIVAGTPVALSGAITLINTEQTTALVVVAVIGPLLGAGPASSTTIASSEPSDSGPAGPSATTPSPPTTAPAPTPTTSTSTTTTAPADDSDGDGLSDGQ